MSFNDRTSAQGFSQYGKLIDYVRHFDSNRKLLNMTDLHTGIPSIYHICIMIVICMNGLLFYWNSFHFNASKLVLHIEFVSNLLYLYIGMSIKISWHPKYHVIFDLYSTTHGTRSLFTEDMKQFYNCIQIDEMFYAQCFKVENLDDIQIVGCHLEIQNDSKSYKIGDETINIIVGKKIVHSHKRKQLQFPCKDHNKIMMPPRTLYMIFTILLTLL